VPQVRPLADTVHSKYSFTYLLTYLLTYLPNYLLFGLSKIEQYNHCTYQPLCLFARCTLECFSCYSDLHETTRIISTNNRSLTCCLHEKNIGTFLPCDAVCTVSVIVILSVRPSVYLSVCPSVCHPRGLCPHGSTYDHDFFTTG